MTGTAETSSGLLVALPVMHFGMGHRGGGE
jgi:hypothetical protein